ncbi:MAG: phytanoyl-CoA dioxygenase family protein [Actinomycetota bacterium]|nr:phytanoyl-CoA dioxygenase family protein [Actinomycetota bacterium]
MGGVLSVDEVRRFVNHGYVRVEQAFSADLAARCVDVLWSMLDVERTDPATWTEPVVRIPGSGDPDVVAAINTPRLVGAINDVLGGPAAWRRRTDGYGTFPVRFPGDTDPGDAGWHIDGSFGEPPRFMVNVASRGRALLLLMLFTDVTELDAPTRIKVGSHRDVARALARLPMDGVAFSPDEHAPASLDREVRPAIGRAGDVFLCHPFLVHAASWPHRGVLPRFIAQPCIHHREGEWQGGFDYDDRSNDAPVIEAVRRALDEAHHG